MRRFVTTIASVLALTSCLSDEQYEAYNQDPKEPSEVESDLIFNFGLVETVEWQAASNVNVNIFRLLAQYWAPTTYPDEANFIFNIRNIPLNYWSLIYRNLLNLSTARNIILEDPNFTEAQKATRLAQTEVLLVYNWQLLVDTFGDIPYTQALNTVEYPLPVYDDAATIYEDLIVRIDGALLDLNGPGYEIDNLYFGELSKWRKFAASLKLRLGIRLADSHPELARSTVESAVADGVFESNEDNATLDYLGISNPNPVWRDLVQSGRKDYVVANTLVDIMNMLDDPRRFVYFDENLGPETFTGGVYGANNTYENYSHVGPQLLEPTTPASLMDFAEVSFYLAEASARGYDVDGTEAGFYEQAVTASFEYWGASGVADYLARPDVSYATAPGDWREKIGLQFWIAMYNRGFEGWTVWRTFDTPALNLPALTNNPIPTRYTYPVNEQNLNETNWINASEAIGGDQLTTRIFWDIQ